MICMYSLTVDAYQREPVGIPASFILNIPDIRPRGLPRRWNPVDAMMWFVEMSQYDVGKSIMTYLKNASAEDNINYKMYLNMYDITQLARISDNINDLPELVMVSMLPSEGDHGIPRQGGSQIPVRSRFETVK